MTTLEPQLKDVKEEDIDYLTRCRRKDLIRKYADEHFGEDYKMDLTRKLARVQADIIADVKKQLGTEKDEPDDTPKQSAEVKRRELIFKKFQDDPTRGPLPPFDEVFKADGTPRYVLCITNNTVWEPSPGMLTRLGNEFETCDKDGVIRRVEDYGKKSK